MSEEFKDLNSVLIAYCTIPNIETGKDLSKMLINQRLAACVNLVPNLISVFKWNDQMHEDPEVLMIIKTTAARKEELQEVLKQNHPYKNPEIIFVPVTSGYPPYLQWIQEETQ
jgi:periplasmic divalent cation tolerance protein